MAAVPLLFVVLLALSGRSSALYCVCKDGVSEAALQKALDFACGAGGDCTPILQNGACYQPNTVRDHCSYAVNSYYQKKVSSGATCDFGGAATTTTSAPSQTSTCVYPSSSTSTTPTSTTTPSTSTTPTTTTTPSTTPIYNSGTGLGPTDSYSSATSLFRDQTFTMTTLILLVSSYVLSPSLRIIISKRKRGWKFEVFLVLIVVLHFVREWLGI